MNYKRLLAIFFINIFFFSFYTPLIQASRKDDKNLIKAITDGDLKKANALLEKEANPNTKNRQRQTALMLASLEGYSELVNSLIEGGADLTAKEEDGWTAFINVCGTKRSNGSHTHIGKSGSKYPDHF